MHLGQEQALPVGHGLMDGCHVKSTVARELFAQWRLDRAADKASASARRGHGAEQEFEFGQIKQPTKPVLTGRARHKGTSRPTGLQKSLDTCRRKKRSQIDICYHNIYPDGVQA